MESPSYGPYWPDIAADGWFDSPSRLVPALIVHGFWDQEDIYGAPAVYAALERHDKANDLNFLAAGPWYHGQHFADGSRRHSQPGGAGSSRTNASSMEGLTWQPGLVSRSRNL
jgi:predicted acyl esterase